MAVVINEFEVVPGAAPQQQRSPGSGSEGGEDKKPPSEHELRHLFEQQISRDERIWAH